jgi:hypothetical protein
MAAKRDQAMAILFDRSGWTQEELADKEGKSQDWAALRLRFGRFWNFTTTVVKVETLPANLTEGHFRALWKQTDKSDKDEVRFHNVFTLIQAGSFRSPNRPRIGERVVTTHRRARPSLAASAAARC